MTKEAKDFFAPKPEKGRQERSSGGAAVLDVLQSRSLYGRHVSTSFLDPVFGP